MWLLALFIGGPVLLGLAAGWITVSDMSLPPHMRY
jgi:hypothetical protein